MKEEAILESSPHIVYSGNRIFLSIERIWIELVTALRPLESELVERHDIVLSGIIRSYREKCSHYHLLAKPFVITSEMEVMDGCYDLGHTEAQVSDNDWNSRPTWKLFSLPSICQLCDRESKWFPLQLCPICGEEMSTEELRDNSPSHITLMNNLPGPIRNHFFGKRIINGCLVIATCQGSDCGISLCATREFSYVK